MSNANGIAKASAQNIADAENNCDITATQAAQALEALESADANLKISISDVSNQKILGKWILQGVAGNIAVRGQVHMQDMEVMRRQLLDIIENPDTDSEVKVKAMAELNDMMATTFPNIAGAMLKAAEIVGISGKAKKQKRLAPQIRNNVTVAVQNNPRP